MSSIPNSVAAQGPTQASPPSAASASEAVRQGLHTHLKKTATFIKVLDGLVLLFSWLAGILVLWLLACLVDHWLVPLPSFLRWVFWLAGMAGTAWWLSFYLLPLLFRKINLTYAARRIEQLVPEFKNGLVAWLELENMPDHGVPRGIMAALAYRAKRFIGDQDPSATVDTSPLIKVLGGVLLLTTAMVVYTMVSPKSVLESGKRVLFPWSSLAPPTRVSLRDVKPGSIEITQGKPLELEVEVRGLRQAEPVIVRFTTTDRQLVDRRSELGAVAEGYRYAGHVTTDGHGVQHELDYWIEAGDARQGPFRVSLSPLPTVMLESVDLQFPIYTKLPPRTVAGSEDIEVIEGTEATLHATANQPMQKAVLEINPNQDGEQDSQNARASKTMDVEDRQLSTTWMLSLNEARQNPTRIEYLIRGFNQRLESNPRPIIHALNVTADLPPEITLVGPEDRVLKVAPSSQVELEVRASDPDFGIAKLKLQVRKNAIVVREITLIDEDGLTGRQVRLSTLDMRELQAQPGDQVQVLAAVQDNRHDPTSKQWAPNQALSEPLLLAVVGPQERLDVPPRQPDEQPTNDQNATRNDQQQNPRQQNSDPNNTRKDGSGNQAADADAGGEQQSASPDASNANTAENTQQSSQAGENEAGNDSNGGDQNQGNQTQPPAQNADNNSGSSPQQSSQSNSASGSGQQGEQGDNRDSQQSRDAGNSNAQQAQPARGNDSQNGNAQQNSSPSRQGVRQDGTQRSGSNASNQNNQPGSGRQLSDGEVMERVQELMERQSNQETQSNPETQSSQETQRGDGQPSGAQSQGASNQSPADSAGSPAAGRDNSQQSAQDNQDQPAPDRPTNGQQDPSQSGNTDQQQRAEASQQNPTAGQAQNREPGQTQETSTARPSQPDAQSAGQESPSDNQREDQSRNQGNQQGRQDNQSDRPGNQDTDANQTDRQPDQANNRSNDSGSQGDQTSNQTGNQSNQSGSQENQSTGQGSQSDSQSAKQGNQSGTQPNQSGEQGSQSGQPSQSGTENTRNQGDSAGRESGQDRESENASPSGSGGRTDNPDARGSGNQESLDPGKEQPLEQAAGGETQSSAGGQPSGNAQSNSIDGGPQGAAAAGDASNQGRSTGSAATSSGEGGQAGRKDEVNQDYAQRTTQMVLDYLNRQKDQPDPELLKDLEWTQEDLQKFVERWNRARDLGTGGSQQDRLEWQEKLRDLGLRPPTLGAQQGTGVNDSFQQMQDSGGRVRPPESWRKQFEAFQRALERSRN